MSAKPSRIEIGADSVTKFFAVPEDFDRELRVLSLGLEMLPALLDFRDGQWIRMRRAEGIPYLDAPLSSADISLLGSTLARFHQATWLDGVCLSHWDNQPRNILFGSSKFTFLDFSDSRPASPAADLTHLLLFWAGEWATPLFSERAATLIRSYTRSLPLSSPEWHPALAESVSRFDTRRALHGKTSSRLDLRQVEQNRNVLASLLDS